MGDLWLHNFIISACLPLMCLQVTLECLHEMFQSAKHTMHWLR